ncbi:TPA: MFS transporter [Pseudomonas aeruginosa]|uniref:MFS transporter n=1 Tax=Pseudomonas citronellolis TaxID=53408 RepID=UPI001A1FB1A9|nr:MFS transporter [Pseudomonas citronellolis]MBH3547434.1 MFS transporter [Pseudomonas aeruginosa]UUC47460.1 MFS transporter [Pseudomonas citronellolis]HBN9703304.1 MFS transporter [Pseudomonas aeruginosa]HBN9721852.1 MFS transporter [Pseudomonas aeruginosa]HBN9767931.1 MFS transporter [Pseudomonas aeruginosa]
MTRLLALTLGMFAIGTGSFVMAGILPGVAASLGVEMGAAARMITAFALTYALLTPLAATFTGRLPRKQAMLGGLLLFSLGHLVAAVAPSLPLALAGRALSGLGSAIFMPLAGASVTALVPREHWGRGLAVVMAGLSGATALGAPLGTLLGNGGEAWRLSMWFVSALGLLAMSGIAVFLPEIPGQGSLRLRDRLAPIADTHILGTLLTTLLIMVGAFTVHSYSSLVFRQATQGDAALLAGLLAIWGLAATVGNLASGSLTDRLGGRRIINIGLLLLIADFALLPWSSRQLTTTVLALVIWGFCGWGTLIPLQHRLVNAAPGSAAVVLGLNTTAIYLGVSASAAMGGMLVSRLEPLYLGLVAAVFVLAGLVTAECVIRLAGSPSHGSDALNEGRAS